MRSIRFGGDALVSLRSQLLAQSPKEAAALLLCGHFRHRQFEHLLVREVRFIPSDAYAVQEELRLEIRPIFLAEVLKRARNEGWSIALCHTHPFSGDEVSFSPVDDGGERKLMPTLFQRAPKRPHGALVLGQQGVRGRLWTGVDKQVTAGCVSEVGRALRIHRPSEKNGQKEKRIPSSFDRSVRALGSAGQQLLGKISVAIVGLGGTGSVVAQQLAYLGVREITLLDPDVVEISNLNRLVGSSRDDVGRPKVEVAATLIRGVSKGIRVEPKQGSATISGEAQSLLRQDFIFCCTDTQGSRALLNQLAYQYMIPTIDLGMRIDAKDGTVEGVVGRVQMLAPGLPCLVCHKLLDPEAVRRDLLSEDERANDPYIVGAAEPQPSVISLNTTIASLAVTMFLSAVTGLEVAPRHQIYLAQRGTVRSVESQPDPNCVVCSLRGALSRGDLWPLPWRLS